MQWKHLFFDLDGTLTDPMQGITRSAQYALRKGFGIEVADRTTLCPFIGPPLKDSFRTLYGLNETEAERAVELFREYFAPKGIFENELYPGIPELLHELADRGATLVMATSKPEPFAERIARRFGFRDAFAFVSGSTLDGARTAKSEVIRHALAKMRIDDPASAVMIGDRRYDIEGAAEAGIEAIGVLWGYGSREELERAGAGRIAADIRELRRMLLQEPR